MGEPFSILNFTGPYKEPRDPVLSYDYSVVRPHWPTPHGVRIQVSIPHELEHLKTRIIGVSGGSSGQQLRVNTLLSKHIADRKLEMANEEGLFLDRRDVKIGTFTGPLAHLFPGLEKWMHEVKETLRQEIREKIGM
ncbi:MAG: hypothetical protein ACREI3_00445 [Nitrospirales bacterium]